MLNLLNFSRLAGRQEFWGVHIIGFVVAFMIMMMMTANSVSAGGMNDAQAVIGLLGLLSLLAILIAQLATTVARIRDAGYSVLWVIAIFVPYFGLIAWIVFGCLESKKA
jgi:uncharacterized membrane protein YhaH (DUF805 family)